MRPKNAFTTIFGRYEILRMPFALAEGASYVIALIQKVFGQINDFCFLHMGDIKVHNTSKNDHLEQLKCFF